MGRVVAIAALVRRWPVGFYAWTFSTPRAAAPATGALVVQSNPAGVNVFVDGVDRGVTPARVEVTAGSHILELRGRGVPRVIPFNVAAGSEVSQYLEFVETPATGQLAVQSEPAGAKVLVDGTVRGVTPLTVVDLPPGDHRSAAGERRERAPPVTFSKAARCRWCCDWRRASRPGPRLVTVKRRSAWRSGKMAACFSTDRGPADAGCRRHELELSSEPLGYASAASCRSAGKATRSRSTCRAASST